MLRRCFQNVFVIKKFNEILVINILVNILFVFTDGIYFQMLQQLEKGKKKNDKIFVKNGSLM